MPRLVIVEPAYASTVGHHREVNRSLLSALTARGWGVELWVDVALEGEMSAVAPLHPAVQGVFSGCGYEDPRSWADLGGMVLLARRLEQQLQLANADQPVQAWLAHSLLPFQILGLARHLSRVPAARVLLSMMFPPGETLEGAVADPQAVANGRVALAALARAVSLQGHRLELVFPSRQQEGLYAPLLQAAGLASAGVHPAVVGAGCRPASPDPEARPLVLLHWGDLKAGKGRDLALSLLRHLLAHGTPTPWQGWGWLFHQHSRLALPPAEREVLEEAQAADLGLVWLQGEMASQAMQDWLARCPLALLAYDPAVYGQRSSGMLWQWAAARYAHDQPAVAVGHAEGWLAAEAAALGLPWQVVAGLEAEAWLDGLARAAQRLGSGEEGLNAHGRSLLSQDFGSWCADRLGPAAA